jgi:molybdenum cofactor guanylyltransferase
MPIAALILAGGQGRRMGGADKAFLTLHGKPLIAHVLSRLAPQATRIAISANGDPARFAAYGLPVLPDTNPGAGPLAGVASGLRWAAAIGAEALATLPVDTPGIPADLLAQLAPAPSVAVYRGRQHHLVALWPTDFLPALENFLSKPGKFMVRDALTLCAARQVAFDTEEDPFLNLNTQEDLAQAQTRHP